MAYGIGVDQTGEWIKLARDSPVADNRLHNPRGLLKVEEFFGLLSDS
jgi:hypothetical protein